MCSQEKPEVVYLSSNFSVDGNFDSEMVFYSVQDWENDSEMILLFLDMWYQSGSWIIVNLCNTAKCILLSLLYIMILLRTLIH